MKEIIIQNLIELRQYVENIADNQIIIFTIEAEKRNIQNDTKAE
jgi:hypothetical protein